MGSGDAERDDPRADVADPRTEREHRRARRRPSGQPPPLPRDLGRTGRVWLLVAIVSVGGLIVIALTSAAEISERVEVSFMRHLVGYRTGWLTTIMHAIASLGEVWAIRVLAWSTVLTLVLVKRWRHALVFLGSILALEFVVGSIQALLNRPRPLGVTIIGSWQGSSMPAISIASLSVVLIGMVYALVPHGPLRYRAKWVVAGVIALVSVAEIYLGTAHPTDALFGGLLGATTAIVTFRLLAPYDVFPVTYGRGGKSAHLDLGGTRGAAIRTAMEDELGLEVLELKPFGLSGSGGSSPMLMNVRGGAHDQLFAKLYAKTHLRADRSYKLGRTILYGGLEDEVAFGSVRRLVEYEDYCQRVMRDAGISVATPYGIVEITPEREYMIVTEFFAGAKEVSEAEIDEDAIDDGLLLVRKMWDAGIAHRDLKPANLLVKDGRIQVIDVAFAQVRPSPWRQAVDLGNMMLVLALRSDAETVYRRALLHFTEDDLAEAFAATRGVAIPSELRARLKDDGRDLLERYRSIAPPRDPIAIQRWSVRRVGLTLAVAIGALLTATLLIDALGRGVL